MVVFRTPAWFRDIERTRSACFVFVIRRCRFRSFAKPFRFRVYLAADFENENPTDTPNGLTYGWTRFIGSNSTAANGEVSERRFHVRLYMWCPYVVHVVPLCRGDYFRWRRCLVFSFFSLFNCFAKSDEPERRDVIRTWRIYVCVYVFSFERNRETQWIIITSRRDWSGVDLNVKRKSERKRTKVSTVIRAKTDTVVKKQNAYPACFVRLRRPTMGPRVYIYIYI